MSKLPAQKHGFEVGQVNAAKSLLNKGLLHNKNLCPWQIAYLKSAAGCNQLNETQARVIRGMELKNNQPVEYSGTG